MSEDVGNHYIDSTVLLDFFLVNALSHFLKLPFRIVTVDIMAADLEVPNLDQIGKAGVIILETPDHVLEQMGATGVVNGISVYDAAILLAAKSRKAVSGGPGKLVKAISDKAAV
ncbi:MAG TPA: hypothetical protein VIV61_15305 [Candidatus Ozemobacteraceae bacterium]